MLLKPRVSHCGKREKELHQKNNARIQNKLEAAGSLTSPAIHFPKRKAMKTNKAKEINRRINAIRNGYLFPFHKKPSVPNTPGRVVSLV